MHRNHGQSSRLYYGWIIAFTLAITETISWGIIYYAFTVFLTPMEVDLGWTRSELTGGFSLAMLIMGGMAYPVGAWVDRRGGRLLMTIGSILATLLVIAWSQVTDIGHFYLIWIGLGVCAALVLYDPAFVIVASWFTRRRSTALAVITFAAGLASTIFVPLSDFLLQNLGWRDAILVLGIFLGLTTIPLHALLLRRHPEDLGLEPDGIPLQANQTAPKRSGSSLADAVYSRYFWMLILAFSLSYLSAAAIRVHIIPFLIDAGIDASSAAVASGAIGLMQVAGRVVFAPLDTRFSARIMVSGVFVLQSIAMLLLLAQPSWWIIGGFIVVFGASFGANTLARVSIIAEHYGILHYGRISSVMSLFLTLAGTAAPVGASLLYDHLGNYDLVVWLALGLALVATLVMFVARPAQPFQAASPA